MGEEVRVNRQVHTRGPDDILLEIDLITVQGGRDSLCWKPKKKKTKHNNIEKNPPKSVPI